MLFDSRGWQRQDHGKSAGQLLMIRDRRQPRPSGPAAHSTPVDLPARVTAEVERSAAYRSALAKLVTSSSEFEATLSAPQRARWLSLEDAMFEYARVYGLACYRAGRRAGRRRP